MVKDSLRKVESVKSEQECFLDVLFPVSQEEHCGVKSFGFRSRGPIKGVVSGVLLDIEAS